MEHCFLLKKKMAGAACTGKLLDSGWVGFIPAPLRRWFGSAPSRDPTAYGRGACSRQACVSDRIAQSPHLSQATSVNPASTSRAMRAALIGRRDPAMASSCIESASPHGRHIERIDPNADFLTDLRRL